MANFLLGFSCNTKRATNTFAEFYALYHGLSIWIELHSPPSQPVWIESDSPIVVNTILGKAKPSHCISPYVLHILKLLRSLPSWKISHIYREGNRAADSLANLGITTNPETMWQSPPPSIVSLLNDDINEVPQFRPTLPIEQKTHYSQVQQLPTSSPFQQQA
ncbi:hypothetical protein QJS10_CPB13g00003 [Acorus calamus]|uniref:RNase H type-1 domain-containing protein n=1 Tax=Acorus calamus TaxID=4465 RepID=A0AAV9DFC1_ACOCL|nr:hypothetical protein QJS10_CPB13g00003 [Acorus calamus]